MSDLFAISIFGRELDWTVSSTVLVLMLVQICLAAVSLIAFILLAVQKIARSRKKQTILVTRVTEPEREPERELVSLTLDLASVQRAFSVGEAFSCAGLVVTAEYSSDPMTETVVDYTVEAPDLDREGNFLVTVRYQNLTATYSVEVLPSAERRPIGLELDVTAVRREFRSGEPFECGGLLVRAQYDSEPYSADVYDYIIDEPSMEGTGERTVAVRYGGFAQFYTITLLPSEGRNLVGIDLDVDAVRADFTVGEAFSCEGLVVIARFDAEPYAEHVKDFTVEEPDLSKKGMTNVVVRYGGFEQSYPVFVAEARALVGISVNADGAKKEFFVGEEFSRGDLVVTAEYDAEPFTEQVEDYTLEVPDLTAIGEHDVVVAYGDLRSSYRIAVRVPHVQEEPEEPSKEHAASIVVTDDEDETGSLRYDFSFTARLIRSDDETKHRYTLLKNELLSYKKVKDRMSWKRETYRLGRAPVAKLGFRGKSLCLFLALDPADYAETRYKVEDVSANKTYEETPCMYRIKNDMRVRRAVELIAALMEKMGAEKTDRIAEDYYLPYEGVRELVDKGLAKRLFVTGEGRENVPPVTEEISAADVPETTLAAIAEEESVEGGTLRYEKSFRAKVIQADDEIKKYYSDLKNELLSYKKVHERLSWKRETYKAEGGCVAKLGFRGNTLCLFLPLDPAEYADTRYKVEDASVNKSSEETPCLFRIKNEKRLRLAFDLIERVMAERGLQKTERTPEDYAEPYRDIVTLIGEGLVRRVIKTKEDEDSAFKRK